MYKRYFKKSPEMQNIANSEEKPKDIRWKSVEPTDNKTEIQEEKPNEKALPEEKPHPLGAKIPPKTREWAKNLGEDKAPRIIGGFVEDTDYGDITYDEFMKENDRYGVLKLKITTDKGTVPLEGVEVTVAQIFADQNKVFYKQKTNEYGVADEIILPAPDKKNSFSPDLSKPYSSYMVTLNRDDFERPLATSVLVYEDTKAVLPINIADFY